MTTGFDVTVGDDGAEPNHDPLQPGAQIFQYEVIRELGRGGMGRVVLARDTRLGRRVAIKALISASPTMAARFIAEARVTAQLAHDNIVVIHEVNEHAGIPFMVLEYLEGSPLSAQQRAGGLPWARVVELVAPIVRALVRAHDAGIVHRDLKPDNVILTSDGAIKVLDFGIAKLFALEEVPVGRSVDPDLRLTDGGLVGTLPYMSPEQLLMEAIDARSDLWSVGIILHELITGRHPIEPLMAGSLYEMAALLDEPLPSIRTYAPELPEPLVLAIDGCLRKHKTERIASARELSAALESLLPGRAARGVVEGESPYLGLTAFQETDAARFFGRARETTRVLARLREHPLIAIAGPSGVGKSSFVRAGIVPALKATELWETYAIRPGRDPITALATMLGPLSRSTGNLQPTDHGALVARLRSEPGALGSLLRARAREKGARVILFVDQLEELYTLGASEEDRRCFADSLAGVADDSATPLRVIVSIRSDFLDRLAESDRLLAEATRGLVFLGPPDAEGLRDALVRPLEPVGYRFESPEIVEDMLSTLRTTPGSLPLLQFVATRLWEVRDRHRRMITATSYAGMGGITGALAQHADEATDAMSPEAQRIARSVLLRLVTPERTRAIVDTADLAVLGGPGALQRVLDHLVAARLLVVQSRGDSEGASVEIVHESLIGGWPRLRRWLDESQEESAFMTQLATAARQWDARGRAAGLIWTGEAANDAKRWATRTRLQLPPREQAYLDAVIKLSTRATRRRRIAVTATIVALFALVAGALFALIVIRRAETRAQDHANEAQIEAAHARQAEATARAAQKESADRLEQIGKATGQVNQGKVDLAAANAKLEAEIATANHERAVAVDASAAADRARKASEEASEKLRQALKEKQAELDRLKKMNRPL